MPWTQKGPVGTKRDEGGEEERRHGFSAVLAKAEMRSTFIAEMEMFLLNIWYTFCKHLVNILYDYYDCHQMAGSVIGKGGQNIQKIRSEFSAQVVP